MKKKIALFLAAALLSVGLIVSCSSGDDPEPSNPSNPSNPGTTVQYTVSFDTDGGDPATIASIKVDAGKAVGAAKWPDDPTKGTDTFGGWYEGTTKYTASTLITKDVSLKASWEGFKWPDPLLDLEGFYPLGEFDWTNDTDPATQKGWTFGSEFIDYTFTDDTWLLLETKGGNMNGFGGLQLVFINDYSFEGPGGEKKYEKDVKGGWDSYSKGDDEIIYFAIQLKQHDKYGDFKAAVNADFFRLYIASYPWTALGFLNAYLVEGNLNKIVTETNKIIDLVGGSTTYGFIATTKDDGIDWDKFFDETFYPVEDLTYSGETLGFTTVSITLNAKVTPALATNSDIVWSTTTSGATINGNTLTATTAGKVTVKATIKDGTEKGTDFVKTFTDVINVITIPVASNVTNTIFAGKSTIDDNKTFGFGGYDGDLDIGFFTNNPTHLVVAILGSPSDKDGAPNEDGWGSIQVALQSPVDGYGWNNLGTGDWVNFSNTADKVVYLVVDISKLKGYDNISGNANIATAGAKVILNYGFKRVLGAWVTKETINTSSMTNHKTEAPNDDAFFITSNPGIFN